MAKAQYCSLNYNPEDNWLVQSFRSFANTEARHFSLHASRVSFAATLYSTATGDFIEQAHSPYRPVLRGEWRRLLEVAGKAP